MKNMELDQLVKRIKKLTFEEVKENILDFDSSFCAALVDITDNEILLAHRFDVVLNLSSKPQLTDIYALSPEGLYQILFKSYTRAAQDVILFNDNLSGDYHYHFNFITKILSYWGLRMPCRLIIHYESEPIILDINGENHFASIDKFQIVGSQKCDYFPSPFVKNKGVLCQEQTQDLLRIAAPYIYNKLPFSTRQLDVLEELANGNDTNTIAKNLGIVPSTVETYRRDIRNIVKDKISTELNDIRFARHLRELMIL